MKIKKSLSQQQLLPREWSAIALVIGLIAILIALSWYNRFKHEAAVKEFIESKKALCYAFPIIFDCGKIEGSDSLFALTFSEMKGCHI